jgi:tetratricopeptide (TPR) repeat protein
MFIPRIIRTQIQHGSILLLAVSACASAQGINAPAMLFRDPTFIKEFVGSYGILSDIEPSISADERVLLARVQELFAKNEISAAEQEIVRFIKESAAPSDKSKKPVEVSATVVYLLGNLYFSSDRQEDARRAFLEAIRRFPRFRRAHTNLGYLYISQNKIKEALPILQRAVELGESSPRVYGLLGYCYLQEKNALAAENAYRQAYLLDPKNRDWKLGLTQALMQQEQYAEAASMLGTLISENPNDRQLWLQQANALISQDKKIDAAVNLEVLRLKGIATESDLNLLGNLYMEQGEGQLALMAYLDAMGKTAKLDVSRALKSARILNDYGFPDKAAEFVDQITKTGGLSEREKIDLDLVRVRIAQSAGQQEMVGALLQDLFARDPGNAELLLELARHYDTMAKTTKDEAAINAHVGEAKSYYKLASEKPDVAYQANLGMGQLLVREKQYVDGLGFLTRALELKTGDKSSLEQYVSLVKRAADRETLRKEREAKERLEKEENEKKDK